MEHYKYLIIGGGMTADTVSDWQDPYRKGVVCYPWMGGCAECSCGMCGDTSTRPGG